MRTHSDVIRKVTFAVCTLDVVGVSIEPIASITDPEDKVDGDYSIRVFVKIPLPTKEKDDSYFAAMFEAQIVMDKFLRMNEERLGRNLHSLVRNILEFIEKVSAPGGMDDAVAVTVDGVKSMGQVIEEHKDELEAKNASKH